MRKLYYQIISIIFVIILSSCNSNKIQDNMISIIPKPLSIINKGKPVLLDKKIQIIQDNETSNKAFNFLTNEIGFENVNSSDKQITFKNENKMLIEGEYNLEIFEDGILIKANDESGYFYAVQTLKQLMPSEIYSKKFDFNQKISIPQVEIKDAPRFKYRGMHLDVCRHFMPVSFVKKYIDQLAMHKMNKFHWHLTEDQGWRIEIKKYPDLTKISSLRKETLIGHMRDKPHKFDSTEHGGFYTQDEIKEVVKYAEERCITIIPEIELPGHSVAALAAYPEISCTGGPFEVETRWGIFDDVYCAGKEETFEFLTSVLDEVVELFPSEYIHIGGDECPKTRWKECPDCQKRIKDEKLKDEHELQSYVIKRIEKHLAKKGKKIIGWDEILEGGLAPEATVMSWRGIKGGIEAANMDHNVIMTPTTHCYFDYYQGPKENEPLAIGGDLPLKTVYSYEPVPAELPADKHKYILGAQANVWTEYMKTPKHVEYMVFPRIDAISEVVWTSKELKDYTDFTNRLKKQMERYEKLEINYSKSHLK